MTRRGIPVSGGVLVAFAFAFGCSKSPADERSETSAASAIDAAAGPVPRPSAPAPTHATGSALRGTYTSAAASLYIPPDWKDVHWKVKETSIGIGEGTIAIHVDPATGRVIGTLEGPLGAATLRGLAADGKLTANIARSDPSDEGFEGTLLGSLADEHAEGTMYVSLAAGNAIRTATFSMSPDGALKAAR
jgi:hypothetical protein